MGEGGGTGEEGRSTGPPGTGDEKERCEIRDSGEKKVNDNNGQKSRLPSRWEAGCRLFC